MNKLDNQKVRRIDMQYGTNWHADPFNGEHADELGEYQLVVHQAYYQTIIDMDLDISSLDEKQRALSPEEVKAVEEELIRCLKDNERTNALMQQFGVELCELA